MSTIPKDDLLLATKRDIYHRLLGDESLATVPVLIDDEATMESREAVDRGPRNYRDDRWTGACVVVASVAVVGVDTGNTPSPVLDVAVVLEVLEDVLINEGDSGTGMNAGQLVARVVQSLHMTHINDRFTGLQLPETGAVAELLTDDAGLRGYAVRFEGSGAAFNTVATVNPVTASVAAGLMTLSCTTSGAAIYYTTDGSYPGPGNAEADLYSEPFAVTSGTMVRTAATKAGMNPSKYVLSVEV